MAEKTIFVCGHGDISVENALLEIDEEYVTNGNVCEQTIFDMLEALKYYVEKDKKEEPEVDSFYSGIEEGYYKDADKGFNWL